MVKLEVSSCLIHFGSDCSADNTVSLTHTFNITWVNSYHSILKEFEWKYNLETIPYQSIPNQTKIKYFQPLIRACLCLLDTYLGDYFINMSSLSLSNKKANTINEIQPVFTQCTSREQFLALACQYNKLLKLTTTKIRSYLYDETFIMKI